MIFADILSIKVLESLMWHDEVNLFFFFAKCYFLAEYLFIYFEFYSLNYNDTIFIYDNSVPENLLDWAYVLKKEEKEKAKKSARKPKRRKLTNYEDLIIYLESIGKGKKLKTKIMNNLIK